jgi:O-antigen/teichoic acid export membrane protein
MKPPRIRTNVLANLAGNAWQAALGLFFPPLFARWMGIEAYGLVGFYASLNTLLSMLFDLSLSSTLRREVARLTLRQDAEARREMADLTRTFEVLFWALGAAFALAVGALAPWLSRHALNPEALSEADVVRSIRLMGLALGLQLAQSVYAGVLLGAQRQTLLNAFTVVTTTARNLGAVLLLTTVSASAPLYFASQAAAIFAGGVALAAVVRRATGASAGASFRLALARRDLRFTAGLWLVYPLSFVLTQGDRLIVGKLLPLAEAGRYSLAVTAANAVYFFCNPVVNAVLPRFTQLHEGGDRVGLTQLFRKASQALIVVMVPAVATLVAFRRPVLALWTPGDAIALHIATAFALRASASAVYGAAQAPQQLSIAAGASRFAASINAAGVLLFLPLEFVLVWRLGIDGAALGWLVTVSLQFVAWHFVIGRQKWLDDSPWSTLWYGALRPTAACALAVAVARYGLPAPAGKAPTLALCALLGLVATAAALLASRDLRPIAAAAGAQARARLFARRRA